MMTGQRWLARTILLKSSLKTMSGRTMILESLFGGRMESLKTGVGLTKTGASSTKILKSLMKTGSGRTMILESSFDRRAGSDEKKSGGVSPWNIRRPSVGSGGTQTVGSGTQTGPGSDTKWEKPGDFLRIRDTKTQRRDKKTQNANVSDESSVTLWNILPRERDSFRELFSRARDFPRLIDDQRATN